MGWTWLNHVVLYRPHRCNCNPPPHGFQIEMHFNIRDHYLRKYTGTTNLDVKLQRCPGQTHLYKKTITHDCCSLFGIGVCKRVLAVSVYQREKCLANFNPLQSHTLCIVRRRLHVPNLVWLMRVCWCTWACMKKLQFRNPQTAPRDKGILFYTVFDPRQPIQQIESVDVEQRGSLNDHIIWSCMILPLPRVMARASLTNNHRIATGSPAPKGIAHAQRIGSLASSRISRLMRHQHGCGCSYSEACYGTFKVCKLLPFLCGRATPCLGLTYCCIYLEYGPRDV